MNILTVDVGGTSVKILFSGQTEARRFASGPIMTPPRMVELVKSKKKKKPNKKRNR